MSFWKSLFGSKEESPEEKKKEDDARNFDVLKYDGVAALKVHELEHAIKCFKKALEIKEDLEIRDYLSQALIQNNELLAAYAQLQKLAEAQPDNIQIWERMAHVAYLMEDYGTMSDACEKALLLDKDNPEVLFLYARACLGQGEEVNAVAMLTKTIAMNFFLKLRTIARCVRFRQYGFRTLSSYSCFSFWYATLFSAYRSQWS